MEIHFFGFAIACMGSLNFSGRNQNGIYEMMVSACDVPIITYMYILVCRFVTKFVGTKYSIHATDDFAIHIYCNIFHYHCHCKKLSCSGIN